MPFISLCLPVFTKNGRWTECFQENDHFLYMFLQINPVVSKFAMFHGHRERGGRKCHFGVWGAPTYHAVFWWDEHHVFHCCIGAQEAVGTPANDQCLQWQASIKLENKSNRFVFHNHTLQQMDGRGPVGLWFVFSSRRGSANRIWDRTVQQHQSPDPGRGWGVTEVAKHLMVDQINLCALDIETMATNSSWGERAIENLSESEAIEK